MITKGKTQYLAFDLDEKCQGPSHAINIAKKYVKSDLNNVFEKSKKIYDELTLPALLEIDQRFSLDGHIITFPEIKTVPIDINTQLTDLNSGDSYYGANVLKNGEDGLYFFCIITRNSKGHFTFKKIESSSYFTPKYMLDLLQIKLKQNEFIKYDRNIFVTKYEARKCLEAEKQRLGFL